MDTRTAPSDDPRFLLLDGRRVPVIRGGIDDDPTTDPPVDPPADPPAEPAAPAPTPPADPVATLRADISDLRSELRRAPPAEPAPRQATAEDIEAAYTSGRITLEQRDAAIDDLRFRARYDTMRARERQQDAESQADASLRALVRKHPDLGQSGSALLGDVQDRLRILAGRGLDPRALGTQLTATEYVLEQRARTSRPTPPPVPTSSGPGSFAGGPPTATPPRDEFADIPQSTRDYWARTGIAPDKWQPYADAYRANQARKAARRAG